MNCGTDRRNEKGGDPRSGGDRFLYKQMPRRQRRGLFGESDFAGSAVAIRPAHQ
jgi:hypothetical protein